MTKWVKIEGILYNLSVFIKIFPPKPHYNIYKHYMIEYMDDKETRKDIAFPDKKSADNAFNKLESALVQNYKFVD